nr:MAG TPA: hypothetical protein [Caudoviricetes sp.]
MKNFKVEFKIERTKPDWKALIGWIIIIGALWLAFK